jgi:hypothetical protein
MVLSEYAVSGESCCMLQVGCSRLHAAPFQHAAVPNMAAQCTRAQQHQGIQVTGHGCEVVGVACGRSNHVASL